MTHGLAVMAGRSPALCSNIGGAELVRYGGSGVFHFCTNIKLTEYAFFVASFLLLTFNFSRLIGIEPHSVYIDLGIVKEQVFILLILCAAIARMEETRYRRKVLRCLTVMLVIFSCGSIARREQR